MAKRKKNAFLPSLKNTLYIYKKGGILHVELTRHLRRNFKKSMPNFESKLNYFRILKVHRMSYIFIVF